MSNPVLVERPEAFDVEGADRVRFLNAYLTCDVRTATSGRRLEGFFTSREGRVLAPAGVVALEDRLRVDVPPGTASALATHLRRYVIADRVVISELGQPLWRLAGTDEQTAELEARRDPVQGAFGPWLSLPSLLVWDEVSAQPWNEDDAEIERARIAAGVPRFGIDYHAEECFPQELGGWGEAGISYDKGCYLGQEVVARIHWRGRVQRGPRTVALPAGIDPEHVRGVELIHEGRSAGRLTSLDHTGRVGLALLHQRVAPGAELRLGEDGPTATVS